MSPSMTTQGIKAILGSIKAREDVPAGSSLGTGLASDVCLTALSAETALNVEYELLEWDDITWSQCEDPAGQNYSPNANDISMVNPIIYFPSGEARIRNSAGVAQWMKATGWRLV